MKIAIVEKAQRVNVLLRVGCIVQARVQIMKRDISFA